MHSPTHDSVEEKTGEYPYARIPIRNPSIALASGGRDFVISWEEPVNPKHPEGTWRQRSEQVYDRGRDLDEHGQTLGIVLWLRGMQMALYGYQNPDGTFNGGGPDHHRRASFTVFDAANNPEKVWTFRRAHHTNPFVAYEGEERRTSVA